jgi:hypothetical protein
MMAIVCVTQKDNHSIMSRDCSNERAGKRLYSAIYPGPSDFPPLLLERTRNVLHPSSTVKTPKLQRLPLKRKVKNLAITTGPDRQLLNSTN